MEKDNYSIKQACSEFLSLLDPKKKEIVSRRFGLEGFEKETLESIGRVLGITRERVRQIEKAGLLEIKPSLKKHQKILNHFKNQIKKAGNLKKEESLLSGLGKGELKNEVYFLLTLGSEFKRIKETSDFYPLWTIDEKLLNFAQKLIKSACDQFKKIKIPLKIEKIGKPKSLNQKVFLSYLEISKKIKKNEEGFWGLSHWPEINPRTIKDKAYLALKKSQTPLHFRRVAHLIGSALPQTVHNELIKDSKFVLVGRGTYALREWGFKDGQVKDVIFDILKEAGQPLKKEEILKQTLKQRLVKENTIFLNLSNRKHFLRTPDGYYKIREA